ncbi:MAG: outer membrane protein assembly factor BamE [Psychrosphaera sp.]|nr:outer membrane protein assembly factor BamE [Psychrosphaera sp.]
MQIVKAALLCGTVMLASCSSWVYRIDIPQGNFLEQKLVNKLRIQMSREQVLFILGSPVARNPFANDKWHYLYTLDKNKSENSRTELVIHFNSDKVSDISGDFEKPEDFDTPLDSQSRLRTIVVPDHP